MNGFRCLPTDRRKNAISVNFVCSQTIELIHTGHVFSKSMVCRLTWNQSLKDSYNAKDFDRFSAILPESCDIFSEQAQESLVAAMSLSHFLSWLWQKSSTSNFTLHFYLNAVDSILYLNWNFNYKLQFSILIFNFILSPQTSTCNLQPSTSGCNL